jgi:hypothetical protein
MKFAVVRFNTYFIVALGCLLGACKSNSAGKKEEKEASTIRFHLEVNPDGTERNGPVPIHRTQPFYVNVEKSPFLTEFNVVKASAEDDGLGGFQFVIRFDRTGTWLLQNYTLSHNGKRIAVFSHFGRPKEKGKGEARWLGAPLITARITNGVFTFTPDATRDETERIARGLNNVAEKEQKYNP